MGAAMAGGCLVSSNNFVESLDDDDLDDDDDDHDHDHDDNKCGAGAWKAALATAKKSSQLAANRNIESMGARGMSNTHKKCSLLQWNKDRQVVRDFRCSHQALL